MGLLDQRARVAGRAVGTRRQPDFQNNQGKLAQNPLHRACSARSRDQERRLDLRSHP